MRGRILLTGHGYGVGPAVRHQRGHKGASGHPSRVPGLPEPAQPLDIYCSVSTANLFLLISSILGAKTAGTHTQFVQWFMEECVDCLEQGSRGSILQFMPFTMVSPTPGTLLWG